MSSTTTKQKASNMENDETAENYQQFVYFPSYEFYCPESVPSIIITSNQKVNPADEILLKDAYENMHNQSPNALNFMSKDMMIAGQDFHLFHGSTIFIFHLPSAVDNFTLYLLFRKFGEILSTRVILNYQTGVSKGYGFVTFSKQSAASAAIEYMDKFVIGNKRLKVQMKRNNSSTRRSYHQRKYKCDGLQQEREKEKPEPREHQQQEEQQQIQKQDQVKVSTTAQAACV